MSDYIHHRKRVRNRYKEEGLDAFTPVHVLELLLFYAIPQKDTKPIARALMEHFGSFHGVLEAEPEELQKVPGVGENAAVFLSLLRDTSRYYLLDYAREEDILNNLEDYGRYLACHFVGRKNETVYLLCMDAKGKVLCCKNLGEGDMVSINLPIRRVVELALSMKAAVVVLGHNHPSGVALPSPEDIALTQRLRDMLYSVGIRLADHIIVADGDYVSLAQSKGIWN